MVPTAAVKPYSRVAACNLDHPFGVAEFDRHVGAGSDFGGQRRGVGIFATCGSMRAAIS